MTEYRPRIYDYLLAENLEAAGAVLVEGPKFCGKTTTSEQVAGSVMYLQDPATRDQNIRLARMAPKVLLEGASPRLIDEWQLAPTLWDAVRFEVDHRDEMGQFILTGSAVPADTSEVSHTGTGRIARMKMRPMSLFESGDSSGSVSISNLMRGGDMPVSACEDGIEEVAFLLCRGGWPRAIDLGRRAALKQARIYLDGIVESDISRVDGVNRDPRLARALLRSYARMSASQGKLPEMLADMTVRGESLGETALREYVAALQKIFVLEDLDSWSPNLRSKTAIRTAPTRHFVDPSIAAAALGVGPGDLVSDLRTFGLLFESMCVRDLRVYMDAMEGDVYHYRDKTGLECDAVLHMKDGRYALVEVKLGGEDAVEEGAASLKKLRDRIDAGHMGDPVFLMVVTAIGGYSYPREDGVLVAPVRTLAP